MRTYFRAAAALAVAIVSFVGPVSAATNTGTAVAQAAPTATITGTVNGSAGTGLAGATVNLDGPTRASTTTDQSGSFSFTVPAGDYTINVNKAGYQTGTTEVVAAGGNTVTVTVGLTESSLENLEVIGKTSTNATGNAAKFNISSTPTATLSQAVIQERDVPETGKLVSTLPGVVLTSNSSSVINNFRIRGTTAEGKTELDGHPVSSGTSGTFVASFIDSGLIGGVDVLKGAGLNGPTAGESAVGTVNFRTPDFSPTDKGFFQAGIDNYGGTFLTALVDFNIGDKLSFIFGKSFSGYVGNDQGAYVDGLVATGVGSGASATNPGPKVPVTYTYQAPLLTNNLSAYSQEYSQPQDLNSQLAKMRYKFSDSTSLSLEFIGFQGTYDPQGGSYGQFAGYAVLPQCLTAGKAASGAGCTLTSVYNSPQTQSQIGQTVPLYTFFPGTFMQNNNPNFTAEFKTTLGNDTIFFRPYAATINRIVNENGATSVYGNGPTQVAEGSYEVISPANCQVQFVAPTAAGGAKGPCYMPGAANGSPAYVVTNTGLATAFPTTTNPAGFACSLATPCYTTETQQNNAGVWGFGNVSTTDEIDKLAGYTFTYIHPVANNIYNFSIDHYFDDTQSFQNDPSPLVAGCSFTQTGGVAPANPLDPGYQAGCGLIGPTGAVTYKPTPIAVPETFSSITSFSLTAQWQLTPTLEFDLGNYLTTFTINGSQESPTFLAAFTAAQTAVGDAINTAIAPIVLSPTVDADTHYDPHFGFVYRPSSSTAVRFTYGSSLSIPYASQVSGLETVAATTAGTTFTEPNPALKPEEVVATDLGIDKRWLNGNVLSADVYNNVIHNAWITNNLLLPAAPSGYAAGGIYYQTSTFNGSEEHAKGIELSLANLPALGWGYSLTTSLNRTYYFNLPVSFLSTPQYQYDGAQAYGEPYSKGYLDLQYAGPNNTLFRVGADYEGPGNSANYTAYVQFDAGVQIGFKGGWALQVAGENLTALDFGVPLGHGYLNQATNPPEQEINAAGQIVYLPGPIRGIAVPLPETLRFSLIKKL